MSGGHFNYKESYLEYIAEQLEHDIECNDVPEEDAGYQLQPLTIDFLKRAVKNLRELKEVLREYDLMVSGDSNESNFQKEFGIG